jgi:YgiT-type zinc finger domain-containing protein
MNRMKLPGKLILKQKKNSMECALCKVGKTEKGTVTITLEKNHAIVLIKDVPAEICTNCGHYYLSEEITRIVMAKGNEAVENGAELEIFSLKVA